MARIRSINKYSKIYACSSSSSREEVIVKKYEPEAYLRMQGTTRQVARPRQNADPPAVIKYFPLSGLHMTSDAAWKDALSKIERT